MTQYNKDNNLQHKELYCAFYYSNDWRESGAYCGVCDWKEKTGCRGCQFHEGEMFYGTCAVATCCSGKDLLHCGLCPDLPCEALQQAFDHPEHGDNGERHANLKAWAKGEDTYVEIGTFESQTD